MRFINKKDKFEFRSIYFYYISIYICSYILRCLLREKKKQNLRILQKTRTKCKHAKFEGQKQRNLCDKRIGTSKTLETHEFDLRRQISLSLSISKTD